MGIVTDVPLSTSCEALDATPETLTIFQVVFYIASHFRSTELVGTSGGRQDSVVWDQGIAKCCPIRKLGLINTRPFLCNTTNPKYPTASSFPVYTRGVIDGRRYFGQSRYLGSADLGRNGAQRDIGIRWLG